MQFLKTGMVHKWRTCITERLRLLLVLNPFLVLASKTAFENLNMEIHPYYKGMFPRGHAPMCVPMAARDCRRISDLTGKVIRPLVVAWGDAAALSRRTLSILMGLIRLRTSV